MRKKIVGILVCTLLIATALTGTGAMNFQTTYLVNEDNSSKIYQYTPANSPGLITIKIVAKVYNVSDPNNLLGGAIKVDDKITGKYIYDSGAPDSNPNTTIGEYWYNSSPCGIEVKAGGLVFKTDPNDVDFAIAIGNDWGYPYFNWDIYEVISFNNLNLSNDIPYLIVWILIDESCTAISSDALPTTAPDLSKWNQSTSYVGGGLIITGFDPYNYSLHFDILADVTKATKSRARDVHSIMQPILLWLFERFPNIFPILRHLMKL